MKKILIELAILILTFQDSPLKLEQQMETIASRLSGEQKPGFVLGVIKGKK